MTARAVSDSAKIGADCHIHDFATVGQPDVERELGALADRPAGQQQRHERDLTLGQLADVVEHDGIVERVLARVRQWIDEQVEREDAEGEAEVTDAVDDEGFLRGSGR